VLFDHRWKSQRLLNAIHPNSKSCSTNKAREDRNNVKFFDTCMSLIYLRSRVGRGMSVPVQPMKGTRGRGSLAPLILNVGTR